MFDVTTELKYDDPFFSHKKKACPEALIPCLVASAAETSLLLNSAHFFFGLQDLVAREAVMDSKTTNLDIGLADYLAERLDIPFSLWLQSSGLQQEFVQSMQCTRSRKRPVWQQLLDGASQFNIGVLLWQGGEVLRVNSDSCVVCTIEVEDDNIWFYSCKPGTLDRMDDLIGAVRNGAHLFCSECSRLGVECECQAATSAETDCGHCNGVIKFSGLTLCFDCAYTTFNQGYYLTNEGRRVKLSSEDQQQIYYVLSSKGYQFENIQKCIECSSKQLLCHCHCASCYDMKQNECPHCMVSPVRPCSKCGKKLELKLLAKVNINYFCKDCCLKELNATTVASYQILFRSKLKQLTQDNCAKLPCFNCKESDYLFCSCTCLECHLANPSLKCRSCEEIINRQLIDEANEAKLKDLNRTCAICLSLAVRLLPVQQFQVCIDCAERMLSEPVVEMFLLDPVKKRLSLMRKRLAPDDRQQLVRKLTFQESRPTCVSCLSIIVNGCGCTCFRCARERAGNCSYCKQYPQLFVHKPQFATCNLCRCLADRTEQISETHVCLNCISNTIARNSSILHPRRSLDEPEYKYWIEILRQKLYPVTKLYSCVSCRNPRILSDNCKCSSCLSYQEATSMHLTPCTKCNEPTTAVQSLCQQCRVIPMSCLHFCVECSASRCLKCAAFTCIKCGQMKCFPKLTWSSYAACFECSDIILNQEWYPSRSGKARQLTSEYFEVLSKQQEQLLQHCKCIRCFRQMKFNRPGPSRLVSELLGSIYLQVKDYPNDHRVERAMRKIAALTSTQQVLCVNCSKLREEPSIRLEDGEFCIKCCVKAACRRETAKHTRIYLVRVLKQLKRVKNSFLCEGCNAWKPLLCNCRCSECSQQSSNPCPCSRSLDEPDQK